MPTLTWLSKDSDLKKTQNVPFRILEKVDELSHSVVGSTHASTLRENLIIQGDNLEALKALLPIYAGQVKCIYIDPPYNTGNAFEHYDDNMEHTLWLSMMYPRLELLREFLREDGSIWVSIDDDECHYLKVMMDEIFGRKNFVNNVIWEKKYSPQNDAKWLSDSHDHILCYAKNKDVWRPNLLERSDDANARYKNPDKDPRGVWKSSDLSVKTYTKRTDYPIKLPSGRIINPPGSRCWSVTEEKLEKLVKDNRIWFGKDGNSVPSIKKFLTEVKPGMVSKTIWYRNEVGDNQEARHEVKEVNETDVFATPKPERLIQRIIQLATNEGDLVLDSFLGSGTTAAVAHKMGRRYIGIEMGEHAVTHVVPRLRKVVEGEQGGISKAVEWKGGGGFEFYKLGETVFDENGNINPKISWDVLAKFIWYLETKTSIDKTQGNVLIGIKEDTAYYLLYNGVLGDRKPNGGNVLTSILYKDLIQFDGKKVIYGESCRMSKDKLLDLNIVFKQIPYQIRMK